MRDATQVESSVIFEYDARVRRRRLAQITLGLGFPLLLLLMWEFAARFAIIDYRFFPAPSTVVTTMVHLLSTASERNQLLVDTWATFRRLALGYVIGATLGIGVGMAMGLSARVRYALGPLINVTYPTPKLALFPLLIVLLGLDDASKVALVLLGVFYTTCISTLNGIVYSHPLHRDVAKAYQIPEVAFWFRVAIPAALPSVVNGLKLGLGQALILVVAVEMVGAEQGIGFVIWHSWEIFDVSRMFLGILVALMLGGGAMMFGQFLERKLTPWVRYE